MFSRTVAPDEAAEILDLGGREELEAPLISGLLRPAPGDRAKKAYLVGDLVICVLARAITSLGVEREKAVRYAEAVLGSRLLEHDSRPLDWVENETQELFCLIADGQLSRIFLRNKEDRKELEVGAVKPVLFPTAVCEINVFRVIRPVVYRARKLMKHK
jgi:hypothetical protein